VKSLREVGDLPRTRVSSLSRGKSTFEDRVTGIVKAGSITRKALGGAISATCCMRIKKNLLFHWEANPTIQKKLKKKHSPRSMHAFRGEGHLPLRWMFARRKEMNMDLGQFDDSEIFSLQPLGWGGGIYPSYDKRGWKYQQGGGGGGGGGRNRSNGEKATTDVGVATEKHRKSRHR